MTLAGIDPAAPDGERTALAVSLDQRIIVTLRAIDQATPAFVEIVQRMAASFRELGRQAEIVSRQLYRMQRGPRSGGRHRGTAAWALRYAPASSAPLGQRTAYKRRMLRVGPRERAAMRAYDRIRTVVGAARTR